MLTIFAPDWADWKGDIIKGCSAAVFLGWCCISWELLGERVWLAYRLQSKELKEIQKTKSKDEILTKTTGLKYELWKQNP